MIYLLVQLIMLVFLSVLPAPAQDYAAGSMQHGTITVVVTGFENDQGVVKFSMCQSEDEYQNKLPPFCTATKELKNRTAEWTLKNIPYGIYSIKVFHDENANGKLDTNVLGMPIERYGFSNQARGQFGPPPFPKAAFTLNAPHKEITIHVQ